MQRVSQKQRECLVLPCQTGEEPDRQVQQREFCPQSSPPKPQSDTFRSLTPCKVSPCSSICHNILIFSTPRNEILRIILLFVLSVRRCLLRKIHLYLEVWIYVMDFLVQRGKINLFAFYFLLKYKFLHSSIANNFQLLGN